jgi:hypothetical protein
MYLAGVSVRRVEDITEALWGTRVSPSTVSHLNKKIYGTIEAWRNRPIEGDRPYVYLDGIVLKRSWAGEVRRSRCEVARQTFRSKFAIEWLDEGVVSGLARSREVERDTALISPEVEIAGDKLCALIDPDCFRETNLPADLFEYLHSGS